jgi:hypothetical protein
MLTARWTAAASAEWYTNVTPDPAAVVPMQRGTPAAEDDRTLNCARNCHGAAGQRAACHGPAAAHR